MESGCWLVVGVEASAELIPLEIGGVICLLHDVGREHDSLSEVIIWTYSRVRLDRELLLFLVALVAAHLGLKVLEDLGHGKWW